MSKRVAIYVRVSSSHQEDDGTSLDTQVERCVAYAVGKGWAVRDDLIFREVASGAKYRERPVLSRMRELVRAREVEVVLAYATDRLSRNQDHVAVLVDEMDHAGVQFNLVTEDFDNTAIGKQVRNTLAFAAELEREKLIERTTRGRRERVLRGKLFPGGKPTYGYSWPDEVDEKGKRERGRLVIDPATAPVVQRIFRDFVGGATLMGLARTLTTEGVPTPTGQSDRWGTSTIARILHNRDYTGEVFRWEEIRMPDGTVPQVVEVEVWEAAQGILTRNKARAIRSAKNPEAALLRGGYVRCGYCLGPMYPRPRSNGVHEYVCKRGAEFPGTCLRPTIVAHRVDDDVWAKARSILTNPDIVREEVEKQRQRNRNPAVDDLTTVERMLDQVAKQQASTARMASLLDDPDAAAPLLARLERLAEQKRNLLVEQAELIDQQAVWEAQQAELTDLEGWCSTVSANLDQLTYQQKRLALDVLGFKVTVWRADHSPRFEVSAEIPLEVVSTSI